MTIKTITWRGRRVEICGKFTPAEAAPRCPNPDRPGFSDQGTAAEVEIYFAWLIDTRGQCIRLTGRILDELRHDSDLPGLLEL